MIGERNLADIFTLLISRAEWEQKFPNKAERGTAADRCVKKANRIVLYIFLAPYSILRSGLLFP
jgi:hypothetical protein